MEKNSSTRCPAFSSDNRKPVVSNVEPSAIQNPKLVGIVALAITLAMCGAVAQAQQPTKIPRILAAELVRLKVNVIVTSGPTATRPAKEATNTIPIVMAQDNNPVENGFVASLHDRVGTLRDSQPYPRS